VPQPTTLSYLQKYRLNFKTPVDVFYGVYGRKQADIITESQDEQSELVMNLILQTETTEHQKKQLI
jgi:hypothetical protein